MWTRILPWTIYTGVALLLMWSARGLDIWTVASAVLISTSMVLLARGPARQDEEPREEVRPVSEKCQWCNGINGYHTRHCPAKSEQ